MGRIVHDDRGAASLEWRDAPDDYERPVLQVEGSGSVPLSIKMDDTCNPYDRAPEGAPDIGRGGKRDLKKLSAWIKLMREMEERKKKGED
jgi:hypothetical protein